MVYSINSIRVRGKAESSEELANRVHGVYKIKKEFFRIVMVVARG